MLVSENATIVFVYNADSGLFNALSDMLHKAIAPETYDCNLCAITYSTLGMKNEWREYIESLGMPTEFLHRDELAKKYNIRNAALPAVFLKQDGNVSEWISAEQINAAGNIEELKQLVQQRLKN